MMHDFLMVRMLMEAVNQSRAIRYKLQSIDAAMLSVQTAPTTA